MNITTYKNAKEIFNYSLTIAPMYDFVGKIDIFNEENATIETDLFDIEALKYYAKKNCGLAITDKEKATYETEYRGGSQGDYSESMVEKIDNVVDSLSKFNSTKRAVVMMNNRWWNHDDTDEAKCLRELHFRLENEGQKYFQVGVLVGRYFDIEGQPTKAMHMYWDRVKEAKAYEEKKKQETNVWPNCERRRQKARW